MPTTKPEWTTERPDEPGFYWWRVNDGDPLPSVVHLMTGHDGWTWYIIGSEETIYNAEGVGSLWWPVRIDPPPVG
jgi:hypothetical protein